MSLTAVLAACNNTAEETTTTTDSIRIADSIRVADSINNANRMAPDTMKVLTDTVTKK